MMTQKQKFCCIYFLSLFLIACSSGNEDLVKYIDKVKYRKIQEPEPLPLFAPLPSFEFIDNGNRRSPFKPSSQKNTIDVNAPDEHRAKQPLEVYPLDALKFVGILQQDIEIWALIQLPNMEVTPVRIGDYMGENYGRIVSIKNESIELIELTQSSGKWEKHRTKVDLYTRR